MNSRLLIVTALGIVAVLYAVVAVSTLRRRGRASLSASANAFRTSGFHLFIGAITNFFDTLGIGSFATTTSIFKMTRLVRDERIPGTLNVGHTLPSILQAVIFITIVHVEIPTLVLLMGASVVGSWFGAGIVARLPRRSIQLGMGTALLVAAFLILIRQLGWLPAGGEETGLSGGALLIGIVGSIVFGALMTIGIGFYAPCMILVSLLGMTPIVAFPIMMGSCGFLMPVASYRFLKANSFDAKAVIGLAMGGLPAVLVAAFLVKSLPLSMLRYMVVLVVVWSAGLLFRSAYLETAPAFPNGALGD